jgi:hypothetical protein
MTTPDPQHPADPPSDGPQPGGAEAAEPAPTVSFDKASFDKPTEQVPAPQAGTSYDQPTSPVYGAGTAQPYDPLPGQAYDPRTGLPLDPPPAPPATAYNAPYGTPPGYPPPYGGYQQPGYGGYPPPGYAAYRPSPTNGMAIASLVLGILWLYWVGSIMALVFGYVARQQIAQRGESGGGLATAGIVLGWIGVGTLIIMLFFVVVVAAAPGPYS